MAASRRKEIWYVHYSYPDGVSECIGSVGLRGDVWHVRFFRGGRETEETSKTTDQNEAGLFLLSRWREQQRKMDADALLRARQRRREFEDREIRAVVSHGLFDAMVDQTTRASHRALEGGVAPWDWWEGPGKEYVPPLGFGCRCVLIGVTNARARRMIESREAFDLAGGQAEQAHLVPDPRWQTWSKSFLQCWEERCRQGLESEQAKHMALEVAAAAVATLASDPKADLDALNWVR